MDARLLKLYDRELAFLRAMGDEFGRRHTGAAARVGVDTVPWRDPHAERIAEAVAALTARVQGRIEDEFPRFTRNLLGLMYPQFLAPTPSMAVARLVPKGEPPAGGHRVPRHTELSVRSGDTRCRYRTAHDVTFWPIELRNVRFMRDVPPLEGVSAALPPIGAVLTIHLHAPQGLATLKGLERLPLYISGRDPASIALFELLASGVPALARRVEGKDAYRVVERKPSGAPGQPDQVAGPAVVPVGFEDELSLLPVSQRSFQGFRLLHEFFALPDRFYFVELCQLDAALEGLESGTELELALLLPRSPLLDTADQGQLESVVRAASLSLYCTPAVNLFDQTARVRLDDKVAEYRVTPGPLGPVDFEVYSVDRVVGSASGRGMTTVFGPLYDPTSPSQAFFSSERRPAKQTKQDRSVGYQPSDVYLSLVDGQHGPYRPGLAQLELSTVCTNRALPRLLTGQITAECDADNEVGTVEMLTGLTAPRASPVHGDVLWQLIAFVAPNFLSLLTTQAEGSVPPVRRLLELCAGLTEPGGEMPSDAKRIIGGLRRVSCERTVYPILDGGPVSYARGNRIVLECEEHAFRGSSPLLLGSVLERFFARYASINAVTETVLATSSRGEVMRWRRAGQRQLL